jgi:hypothetical protein
LTIGEFLYLTQWILVRDNPGGGLVGNHLNRIRRAPFHKRAGTEADATKK